MNPSSTLIFAFNRPLHLKKTLDALAANTIAKYSPLTIICDGPRSDDEKHLTDEVRSLAHAENRFASVEVVERDRNWGLADNIIDGVTEAVKRYGRVIVLEDDLLTSPYFLQFMNDGLDIYADDPDVASIVGWCFPHNVKLRETTFFLKGTDCWGWATWKRAWDIMETDARKLIEDISNSGVEKEFNANGCYDYTGMLNDVVNGTVSSWAVRWHASAFLRNMYSLFPAHSLVFNNGYDTGTHFSDQKVPQSELYLHPIQIKKTVCQNSQTMESERDSWLIASQQTTRFFYMLKQALKKIPFLYPLYKKIKFLFS